MYRNILLFIVLGAIGALLLLFSGITGFVVKEGCGLTTFSVADDECDPSAQAAHPVFEKIMGEGAGALGLLLMLVCISYVIIHYSTGSFEGR